MVIVYFMMMLCVGFVQAAEDGVFETGILGVDGDIVGSLKFYSAESFKELHGAHAVVSKFCAEEQSELVEATELLQAISGKHVVTSVVAPVSSEAAKQVVLGKFVSKASREKRKASTGNLDNKKKGGAVKEGIQEALKECEGRLLTPEDDEELRTIAARNSINLDKEQYTKRLVITYLLSTASGSSVIGALHTAIGKQPGVYSMNFAQSLFRLRNNVKNRR